MTLPNKGFKTGSSEIDSSKTESAPQLVQGWRRILFLALAFVFFLLAIAGAFLPGIPATPFLLLTSYLLLRSSPQLNDTLLRSKFFGPILTDWQQRRGVRKDVKIQAIVLVLIAVAVTIWLNRFSPTMTGVVLVLAAIGITVIVRLPTIDAPR